MSDSVWAELRLELREVFHQQGCQETILSEREQILLVQCVDVGLGVLFDDTVGDDDWTTFVGGTDAVERETTGQASDGSEEGLEGLGEMVRDIVLVDLDHGPPRCLLVAELRLSADTNDRRVVCARSDKAIEGVRSDRLQDNQQARSNGEGGSLTVSASIVKMYS